MEIAVIIPTYNEKDNIARIISAVNALELQGLHLIVVDDNSPDGTARLVEDIRRQADNVHLLKRPGKLGLGSAYREGFAYALANGANYVFEMDADFSHDPEHIPIFLEYADSHDVVVGSRYIPAGMIKNWNWSRRLVSWGGNLFARTVLNVPVKDLTTGYKCYRREVIEHLLDKEIDSVGYVFQVETSYHAHKKGFKLKEIPIAFTERRLGKSKFNFAIICESFWKVFKLRFRQK